MPRYVQGWFLVGAIVVGAFAMSYMIEVLRGGVSGQTLATAKFGDVSLVIDLATTTAARELGLGGRTSIPSNYGMLFVFPSDSLYGFWMKDTLISLDMFWLDSKGHVVYVARDVATSSYPRVFYPTIPARYVLETTAGFARTHEIKPGTPLLLKNFPIVLK